jgi:hypothetical protein
MNKFMFIRYCRNFEFFFVFNVKNVVDFENKIKINVLF